MQAIQQDTKGDLMMSNYIEVYTPFNNCIKEDIDIDWFALDSGAGVYPDTALMLIELVKRPEVRSVLELGSGASTIFLQAACSKYDKDIISIEEGQEYVDRTKQMLSSLSLEDKNVYLSDDFNYSEISHPDLIFLDSQASSRGSFLDNIVNNSWSPALSHFIVMDDAEAPHFTIPMNQWLTRNDRYNTQIVNLGSRQDRSQLINCIDNNFHICNWTWDWRPNKLFW